MNEAHAGTREVIDIADVRIRPGNEPLLPRDEVNQQMFSWIQPTPERRRGGGGSRQCVRDVKSGQITSFLRQRRQAVIRSTKHDLDIGTTCTLRGEQRQREVVTCMDAELGQPLRKCLRQPRLDFPAQIAQVRIERPSHQAVGPYQFFAQCRGSRPFPALELNQRNAKCSSRFPQQPPRESI